MTTKTISTYITAGYSLLAKYSTLDITSAGGVGGFGVQLVAAATLDNSGFVDATGSSNGVVAYAAATIVNGSAEAQNASIRGYSGVFAPNAAATVTNFGLIRGTGNYGNGVFITHGGMITNGAGGDTSALIYGVQSGVNAGATANVVNFGSIHGRSSDGVYLKAGGSITNGSAADTRATIMGETNGVFAEGALTVSNFRTISGGGSKGDGVTTTAGGTINNGSAADTTAVIYGRYAGIAVQTLTKVGNFATVKGDLQDSIYLPAGGSVTNGSTTDTRALIQGATEGIFAPSNVTTVSNFATILDTVSGDAIYLGSGLVTNGSTLDTGALIEGTNFGIRALTASTTVNNFGVINALGVDSAAGLAVSLKAGGMVTNGSAGDTTALIEGTFGVEASGLTTIANFGTIDAFHAVYVFGGGKLTNGSAADTTALILGETAVNIESAAGTVANFGTIVAYGANGAVELTVQGVVTNGSAADTTALIDGGDLGVLIAGGGGALTNFGTILADINTSGASGVYVDGGTVTNGSAADTTALMSGRYGLSAGSGSATVTNYGTIHGFSGVALYFLSSGDYLNVEAGCAFQGAVKGGGGVLDLASGVGTITGLTAADNVVVTGSMARTTFQNFGVVEIGAGATFTDTALVSVVAGRTVADAGTLSLGGPGANSIVNAGVIETTGALTLAGAVKNTGTLEVNGGTLTVNGAVTSAGVVDINGGKADFASTFAENVAFTAVGGVLELAKSVSYTGKISGFATTPVSSLDLVDIGFTSGVTKATYSGTTASGTLTVTDGTHTARIKLTGNYTASTFTVASDGHDGTTVTDPSSARSIPLVAAMAAFASAAAALGHSPPSLARPSEALLAKPY